MTLSSQQCEQYTADGFVILPALLDAEEVAILRREIGRLAAVEDECVFREGVDGTPKSMFRMHETDGPTASAPFRALSRTPRVLGAAQQALNDEALYIHHCKLNMKGAIEGTVWPWHQDFGSWHLDGIREPHLTTIMVMLDDATELGGCLYFLPGSHKRGRITPRWDDTTAYKFWALPPDEVRAALADCGDPVPITGKSGDAVIFDCNLLHASSHNLSAHDRWQVYFCYNRVANRPHEVDDPRPDYVRSQNWQPIALGPDTMNSAELSPAAE